VRETLDKNKKRGMKRKIKIKTNKPESENITFCNAGGEGAEGNSLTVSATEALYTTDPH
jgi:hypothetical protein